MTAKVEIAEATGIGFAPDWGEGHILSLREGDQSRFEPGMVVHVVPALGHSGLGGVAFSETVLVTPEGNQVLTNSSRRLC